jgi:hypothetical protein
LATNHTVEILGGRPISTRSMSSGTADNFNPLPGDICLTTDGVAQDRGMTVPGPTRPRTRFASRARLSG